MARSIDTWVTNNLDQILRMVETGPKIAQKYIHNPCLYNGRKFDLRFVVMLKSIFPLELYVYDEFYSRFSNNQFEMNESSFPEYETHFTVMNYKPGVTLTNVRWFDFEKEFDRQYGDHISCKEAIARVHEAIKQLFISFQVKFETELSGKEDLLKST
mmetsp:Transcript_38682/g.28550  ORF Transcript_38682/g.28550 Transcript_38682/m.28550 type:complete len:157 (+) Transcript_38682:1447-1917(+)